MLDQPLDNPLWRYATQIYRQPGVADQCLLLQDRYDLNVNLLLLALWVDCQGLLLPATAWPSLEQTIAPLDQQMIRPLRQLRRQALPQLGLESPWQQELKHRLLAAELYSEQISMVQLFQVASPMLAEALSSDRQELTNGQCYAASRFQPLPADLLQALEQLKRLTFI